MVKIEDYAKKRPASNSEKVNIQTKINTVLFQVDRESHIKLNEMACAVCKEKPCLNACPAGMFSLSADGKEVIYSHEGCLECGTCYVICDKLNWEYPKGGYGVIYRES